MYATILAMTKDFTNHIEYLEIELNDIKGRRKIFFSAGLMMTIIFGITYLLCAAWLVSSIVFFVKYSSNINDYNNLVANDDAMFWLFQLILAGIFFFTFLVGLFCGVALMIISVAVFGAQARHRQQKIFYLKNEITSSKPIKVEE